MVEVQPICVSPYQPLPKWNGEFLWLETQYWRSSMIQGIGCMSRMRECSSGGRIFPSVNPWENRKAVSIPIFYRDLESCLWEATFLKFGAKCASVCLE